MFRNTLSWTVFRKELRETLRDKRVILGVIVSPLVVTPLIIGVVAFFAGKKVIQQSTSTLEIGIVEEGSFPSLMEKLEEDSSIESKRFESKEEAVSAVEDRSIRAVLVIKSDSLVDYENNRSASLEIIYNAANENSQNTQSRLRRLIREFDRESLAQRIEKQNLPKEFSQPTSITDTNIATGDSTGSFYLGLFLPYLIVISAAFGGIQTAFDLCAGEKERGTMETLLVSPASRYDIVQGKLLTIFTISLIASICAITGIVAPLTIGLEYFRDIIGSEISFKFTSVLALLLIVIPLALFTSSLLLVISSFARNQKEAQTYIFPFISIVLFPAMLSSIIGAETQLYTAFIPILNISLTMKQILGDVFDPTYFVIALTASFIYAFLAMRLAGALFQREAILFRA